MAWRRCGVFLPVPMRAQCCCTTTWGIVVASMHSDRKAAAHIAKAAGVPSLVLNYALSPL